MFDTMEAAKKIKQARIDKNMTQMQLADAMGVSYQAVSNWERGNSMPDISKLADLCSTLDITVNELLGMEAPAAAAVTKAMDKEELSVEELVEVAPMLPPEEVKEQVEAKWHIDLPDMGFLKGISDTLKKTFNETKRAQINAASDEIRKQAEKIQKQGMEIKDVFAEEEAAQKEKQAQSKKKKLDLCAIAELAPFLDAEYLDGLVMEAAQDGNLEGLDDLAPFLSQETLNKLVQMANRDGLVNLANIVPFLSEEAINTLVCRCLESDDPDMIEDLAPFLSNEAMDIIVEHCLHTGNTSRMESLYPFLSAKTLRRIASHLARNRDFDAMEEIADYL